MSNINEILLPDVGGEEVEIIEIVVKKGDSINIEDPILTVETEKASMDIPSLYSGMIQEINVKVGDKVSQGSLICSIKDESSSSSNSEDKKSDIKNDEVKVEISKEVSQETNKNEENLSKDNNNSNASNTLQLVLHAKEMRMEVNMKCKIENFSINFTKGRKLRDI